MDVGCCGRNKRKLNLLEYCAFISSESGALSL